MLASCADADIPELRPLANSIDPWRDELLACFDTAGPVHGLTEPTQDTLGRTGPGQPAPPPVEAWRLAEGDLVVVDEANMTDAAQLLAIQRRCEAADAKP